MDNEKQETQSKVHTEVPPSQPEMIPIGKVIDITHGGGRVWGDGQKNQERA